MLLWNWGNGHLWILLAFPGTHLQWHQHWLNAIVWVGACGCFWGVCVVFCWVFFFGNSRNWKIVRDSVHHTACGLVTTFALFGRFLFEEEVTSFQQCLNDRSNLQSLISPQRKTLLVFCVKMPEWSESPCWITYALSGHGGAPECSDILTSWPGNQFSCDKHFM